MEKRTQFSVWYFACALLGIVLLQNVWQSVRTTAPIPYSEFQQLLREGKVADIAVSDNQIIGSYKEAVGNKTRFVTTRVDPALAKDLAQYDVKVSGIVENTFLSDLMGWVLPAVIFVGIWIFAMRRFAGKMGGGGFMNIGKSKAKVYVETDTKVNFADVAGVEEAKDELKEIVGFLKDPESFGRLGGRAPKGVLLVGPPGTGKTLLAKAVAGEAGVPFFSISGSEFVEMFVGVGAARVRDLFEQARAKAPAIIFIDELDALGRARAAGGAMGGHDEKEQTLNQLLVELDGFDSGKGLVLLGATNRPEVLDPALLRAGRFDRQVVVDRPDKQGRVAILQVHIRKIELADGVDLTQIADLTPGFTGAELANLCNEAALAATRRQAEAVTLEDFTVAVERIVAGLEKRNRVLSPLERETVAHHEMGHAIAAMSTPGSDPVHKVSIIPRGIGALGYTIQRPTEERYLMTRAELENRMVVLLGGRAAEEIIYGHFSTGASDDLQRVTQIARALVTRYGMHPDLGHVVYEKDQGNYLGQAMPQFDKPYSEETAREIDLAVRDIVQATYRRTLALLKARESLLRTSAADLLARETLGEAELASIRTAAITDAAPAG
ncbi:ATP-dependent zinc metalloprotease FtsH [Dechloromonas sp.]|uniref:ATP-dependent zinc metalloprotease FtsH n=1 Tax=Dechloromonas sp. TaxID=1917218 RepID=UPI001214BAC9|nr:ATP-dependent zinc metalloprotease FtsH [Dechloromonas sp.]MBU3697902.1 ATP-dependent zinc metalloprotease FtsH [Dechloromonas sp.]TEX48216.1 MAG: cell division protein FtsH [Rhodocyclaceae bacterium]